MPMNENVIFNRTFKNMLAVKDENGEDKLFPVAAVTTLFRIMQFYMQFEEEKQEEEEEEALYFSLLNTCQTHSDLNKSFSNENISFISSKTKIPEKIITDLYNYLQRVDIAELMYSISPDKNEPIRLNFVGSGDDDFIQVMSTGDILSLLFSGTGLLEQFPKNEYLYVLINKNAPNLSTNIKIFFGLKKIEKEDLNFNYIIPTYNGILTICDAKNENGKEIYNLNSVGQEIANFSLKLLKDAGATTSEKLLQDIKDLLINRDREMMGLELKKQEDYKYYIELYLLEMLNGLLIDNSPKTANLPEEVSDFDNWGHVHYFQLIIYVCLLPYLKKGLEERRKVGERVLQITNDFQKKSLPEKYLNDTPVQFIITEIYGDNVSDKFIERVINNIRTFHNCMFSKDVIVSVIGNYHVTQFNFFRLKPNKYNDGFIRGGKFVIPIGILFKYVVEKARIEIGTEIEPILQELFELGNQQIPDKIELFKFPCIISELGGPELNELESEQVIENIDKFSNFQIKEFAIKNIINVFECVCALQKYTEDVKQNVFSKFFTHVDKLIVCLSAEQILNWQNYISASKLEYDGYKLLKDKMIKLAGYINENKFSLKYEKAFFYSLSQRGNDKIDIYKVISLKKFIDNQNNFYFTSLVNFDGNGQFKSFIDEDFQSNLLRYLYENLSDKNVKRFITEEYISDLFFKIYDIPINEIYNLFYTDNDDDFRYKFFPKNKVAELIIFMEKNNIQKDMSQKLKIYTSRKYIFNEFLNYIFAKEEDEQLLNSVVKKMKENTYLISWLNCEQILKFANFYSGDMEKEESNQFFKLCKKHLENDEFFQYVAKNIANFPKNLLNFFPRSLNYLSCKEIWNLQEELANNEILTFAETFDRFYELTDYVFKKGKDINLLRAILREKTSLIKQIICWPKYVFCRPDIQISEDEPITYFYMNNISSGNNAGLSTEILYTTPKRINEILHKTEFFYKLILNDEEKFDEDFISVIKQDINVYDLDLIFFAFEYKYGIDNVPENYKLLLQHFVDNLDLESFRVSNFKLESFLPFTEFYFNFTEKNEKKFVSILEALINKNLHVLKYFLSDDENERLNFKNEIFHYTRDFTESESTKLFVAYCQEKIKNDITINLSIEKIFTLWEIGKVNELNKMLMNIFLSVDANNAYLHSISGKKEEILKDMLKYDNRLVKKLSKTNNYGILGLFTPEQIVIVNEDISKESFKNFSSAKIHNLFDYISDNDIEIKFSFFEKIIYSISEKFDSDSVIYRFERKKLEKLFEKVEDASKDEKFDCFMTLYNGYCFYNMRPMRVPAFLRRKHSDVEFINNFFDSSFKFADISINDFFSKVPNAKESYLKPIKSGCDGFKLFLLIMDGLCSLPVLFYSAIAVYGFVIGVTSLGTFLGFLIASILLLSVLVYSLIMFAKNKIKLWRIKHASSYQNLSPESPTQSQQTENNIENQEQQQNIDQPPMEQPPRVPSI